MSEASPESIFASVVVTGEAEVIRGGDSDEKEQD